MRHVVTICYYGNRIQTFTILADNLKNSSRHIWILLLGLASSEASARFILEDSFTLDRDEKLNTESFNDRSSYRYPLIWEQMWDQSDTGFQLNAGSLNHISFEYMESIKLKSDLAQPAAVSLERSTHDIEAEFRTEQEFKLSYRPFSRDLPLRFGILGDGGSQKQFGDLGISFGWWSSYANYVDFFVWSVDHFYNSKMAHDENKRIKETDTYGIRLATTFHSTKFSLRGEKDTPLIWSRPSHNLHYEYERHHIKYKVEHQLNSQSNLGIEGQIEQKTELRRFTNSAAETSRKMSRRYQHHYMFWNTGHPDTALYRVIGEYVWRDTYYRPEPMDKILWEETYNDESAILRVERRESGLHMERYSPLTNGYYWQLGLHNNLPSISERFIDSISPNLEQKIESKIQVAVDFVYSESARCLLNTTWDLDQLSEDFPYDDRPFRPWGGGNIQFIAVF